MFEISGNIVETTVSVLWVVPLFLYTVPSYTHIYIYICTDTLSLMIEDAAMKDERGDDVPDNESNEWEVGRERMCALPRTEMCSPCFTGA